MPISSGAYAKLFVFFLAAVSVAGTSMFAGEVYIGLAGALPLVLATFGLGMAWRSRSITHIRTAGRMIAGLFAIACSGFVLFGLRLLTQPYSDPAPIAFAISIGFLIAMIGTQHLYTQVLDPFELWVSEHGLFPPRGGPTSGVEANPITAKTESFSAVSVADEMLKWSKLHADGVITDDEFVAAKKRLLA